MQVGKTYNNSAWKNKNPTHKYSEVAGRLAEEVVEQGTHHTQPQVLEGERFAME